MLELTRKKNETIIINDNIKMTVLSYRPGQVMLGIEAPDYIEIRREEFFNKQEKTSSKD